MKKRAKKSQLGGKRPGAGRKPIADEAMVNQNFRCLPSQWERWKAAADAAGKSLSQWLRDLADKAAADAGIES